DADAQLRCVMWREEARRLPTSPEEGMEVRALGRLTLYEARGEFQLVVEYAEEAGQGALRRRFEELKRKLAAEGLFDAARKRAIPKLPRRIGVVTSPTGAALRDVLIALQRRFPAVAVLVYPTAVQGIGAAEEIARTLALADKRAECDVLILTRGGGSLEDLWSFNEEVVARAVAAVELPIIVGVGHEIDFTIADFVADLRAPTPSQAAELAVPDQREWLGRFALVEQRLTQALRRQLAVDEQRVAQLAHRLNRCHPGVQLRERAQRLDELEARLRRAVERRIEARKLRLARLATAVARLSPGERLARARERWRAAQADLRRALLRHVEHTQQRLKLASRALQSLSPLATLERGYAIVTDGGGKVLTDAAAVARGTAIDVRLARGALAATVDKVTPRKT
ncbi:MAG TPA: exodeoxyribonuclease VII large subunit, partial [Gammaproteobacteria bacterium]|nr:exodeoxyribonuclease VII large subunit [Gammaproteobacteria bacterium]